MLRRPAARRGSDAADSAELWASVGPAAPLGAPAPDLTGPLAGMLGNLLAFEVFRLTTEALPAETRHQIVVQDLDSLDVLTEPLLPHPRCPYCAAGETGVAEEAGGPRTAAGSRTPAPPRDSVGPGLPTRMRLPPRTRPRVGPRTPMGPGVSARSRASSRSRALSAPSSSEPPRPPRTPARPNPPPFRARCCVRPTRTTSR
ncbi:hypothetical protein ACFQ51_04585 [Streptomyces kaempferi]